jgi:hypothetical protein
MVAAVAVDVVVVAVDVAAVAAEAAVAAAALALVLAAVVSEAAAYRGASAVFADPRRAFAGHRQAKIFWPGWVATRPILVRTAGLLALARPNSLPTTDNASMRFATDPFSQDSGGA